MELLGNINKDYTVNVLKWGYLKNKIFGDKKLLPDEYLHTIR